MSLELIILGLLLMGICAGVAALFLKAFYDKSFTKALIFKGIASLCFVIFGALNCFIGGFSVAQLMIFVGLCFGIIGDEVIALGQVFPKRDTLAFVSGGLIFGAGHILYILSLLLFNEINWTSLAVSFVLIVVLCLVYDKHRNFLDCNLKLPFCAYLGSVAFVAATAIGLLVKNPTLGTGLFVLGGACFIISDNILLAYKFGREPKFKQNLILHVAYYLAQFAIAWSIAWM